MLKWKKKITRNLKIIYMKHFKRGFSLLETNLKILFWLIIRIKIGNPFWNVIKFTITVWNYGDFWNFNVVPNIMLRKIYHVIQICIISKKIIMIILKSGLPVRPPFLSRNSEFILKAPKEEVLLYVTINYNAVIKWSKNDYSQILVWIQNLWIKKTAKLSTLIET